MSLDLCLRLNLAVYESERRDSKIKILCIPVRLSERELLAESCLVDLDDVDAVGFKIQYLIPYRKSDLEDKKKILNNLDFDPCGNYNKYKYQRNAFIYILSASLSFIDFFVETVVEKLISFQKFESKSNEIN